MKLAISANIGFYLIASILAASVVSVFAADVSNTPTTQVIVGNAAPTVANVTLNAGNAITLTANATTAIRIAYQISDNNGCGDIDSSSNGTTTVYRSGVSASCTDEWIANATSNLNCYRHITTVPTNSSSTRATSSCSGTTINVTDTVDIYYFAQATDASSSFAAQNWAATVFARDLTGATGTAAATAVELNTLIGIRVSTSSINYNNGATMSASSTTGVVTTGTTPYHAPTSTNVGNSSTTYSLRASTVLTKGGDTIANSNQRWATSSFNMTSEGDAAVGAVTSTALTGSNVNVPDHILQPATTTAGTIGLQSFWGLRIPAGTPTGTYTGTNVFTGVFQP